MIRRGFRKIKRSAVMVPHESRLSPLIDALLHDASLHEKVWEAASSYALDGESLQTLLDDLDQALSLASLPAPDAALVRSIALAWSDAFLGLYSRITCVDPLTGLATRQHLQTHVAGLYAPGLCGRWAIIVIETDHHPRAIRPIDLAGQLTNAVGMTAMASAVGRELVRGELMASLSIRRCGIVAPRDDQLPRLVLRLEERAQQSLGSRGARARVWVEGLPTTVEAAASLVDELCR